MKTSFRDRVVQKLCNWIIKTFSTPEYSAYVNTSVCLGLYVLEDHLMELETLSPGAQIGLEMYCDWKDNYNG